MAPEDTSRRDFIGDALCLAAGLTPVGLAAASNTVAQGSAVADSAASPGAGITAATIGEAEKLHALHFTVEQRAELAATMPAQVKVAEALRSVPRSLDLQPALHLDPRLPGKSYPRQENRVRLASREVPPLPQNEAELAYAPVTHLSHWIRSGQLTSTALTELYLARIAGIAPRLFCYITVTAELARAQAKAMDAELKAGKYRGALHGVPYSLKDVFDTAGVATTWGCSLYRERLPTEDAAVVKILQNAGAVLLGKVAMGELANGWEWFGGKCRNPWNPEEPAGGSSSGSASATAAGLCAFSIGTDSLGSILNPADRCGIVGLRPTFGRVPVKGAMPLTPSLERIGPLCRSVEDAVLVLAAINGYDPSSASSIDFGFAYDASLDPRKLRVGYSPAWFDKVGFGSGQASAVTAAEQKALQALRELGATLVPVQLPDLPYAVLLENLYVEAAAVFEELTLTGRDAELINRVGWPSNWRRARLLSAVDYLQIERFRRQVMLRMHELFETVDLVFGPTYGSFDLFMVMNYTGQPGVTLRAGFAESPTRSMHVEKFFSPEDPRASPHTVTSNVAFHGKLFEEGKMLALAHALEVKLAVSQRHPTIG